MTENELVEIVDGHTRRVVREELKETEGWLKEVQARQDTARNGYSKIAAGDQLKHTLPERFNQQIENAAAAGLKDPVGQVALGAWWALHFAAAMEKRHPTRKGAHGYFEELDRLERGWGFDPVKKAVLGETLAGGGNVIATPVEAEFYRLIRDNTIVRPLATKILMSSLTHQLPLESNNVTAYIVPENTVITDSMTTLATQKALTAKVFAGLATVQNQLFQDNIIGLQQYLFTAIAEHIGILEDQGALDGGTPSVQNFSGVAVSPSVNSMAVNGTGVSGGSAPSYAELVQCIYTATQSGTRRDAAFFMLPAAFKNIANLVDTTGQPIFSFANVPGAIPQMIGGYPVYTVSSLSSAWSAATTSTNIYFGPPSKIVYGDVAGMFFDLDPYSLLDKIQTRVRVMKRTGICCPVGSYFTIMKQVKYV